MKRKLYYFTYSFPYGIGEQWKWNEIQVISHFFSEIEIIPNNFAGNQNAKKLNFSNVLVAPPLFADNSQRIGIRDLGRIFFSKHWSFFLAEFIKQLVFLICSIECSGFLKLGERRY